MTMSDPLKRFRQTSGAHGAAQARLVSTRTDPVTGVVTSRFTTPATTRRYRWIQRQSPSGTSCIDEDTSAEVMNVTSALAGDPIESDTGNALISKIDQVLMDAYPDDISSALAARRKIYLVVGELLGAVKRHPDNTFTILDPPI